MNELSEFIMDELSKFIKAHVNEINNNNFAKVYEDTNDSLTPCLLTSKLTELFLDAGLEPLEYMQAVPANYLAYSKLTSITIPENITSIGVQAFLGCDRLRNITFNGTIAQWKAIDQIWCWPDDMEYCIIHCTDGDLKE